MLEVTAQESPSVGGGRDSTLGGGICEKRWVARQSEENRGLESRSKRLERGQQVGRASSSVWRIVCERA